MKAPFSEQWVHEVKHDGYRLLARKVDGRVRLYTKRGYDWSKKYPLIAEALYRLRVSSVVLDGEAMCFTNGMQDFDKLWSNCFDETVRLCAFDLLELNGEDYRTKPLAERKKRLAKLLARPRDGIEYVEHLDGIGQRIFEHAC
jgi:ATP-dependent DNA ligase